MAVPIIGGDATNNTDLVKIGRGRGRRVPVHFPDHARGHRHPDGQGVPQGVRGEVPQPAQLHLSVLAGDAYNVLIAAIKPRAPTPPPLRATSITI